MSEPEKSGALGGLVGFAISRPVAVTVGLILILLFGGIGLSQLPQQLTPNVTQPEISVSTTWTGATPYEIEREIIEPQQDMLKNIKGLEEYEASARNGRGRITLRFELGTNLQDAFLDVSNKVNEVRGYPENVDRPVIRATGETASPVIWMMVQTLEGNDRDISTYGTFLEDYVLEHLERVEGVGELFVRGDVAQELHVVVDPMQLAAHGLTVDAVSSAIARENIDISAGTLDLGKRTYRVRTAGRYESAEALERLVLLSDGQRQLLLGDVADIKKGHARPRGLALFMGQRGVAVGVRPDADANVVAMTDRVEAVVEELNAGIMADAGIYFRWAYDQRPYILGAIDLVKQNIAIGGLLAVMVLLIFLRAITPTAAVAIAIPMSIIGTFIVLYALDRSLNIISMAGISFAVGMLVDSAIVVLENIDRHRLMGKRYAQAALDGTQEVWGALIISALTTIAVFAPIIFLEDEAGQLFRDIALAVTAAVSFSLFISVFAIPMIWRQMMRLSRHESHQEREHKSLFDRIGSRLSAFFMALVDRSLKSHISRLGTVAGLVGFAVIAIWLLFPKMEYLPEGNRNMIQNIFIPPPGLSFEEIETIGHTLFDQVMPYVGEDKDGVPAIQRSFFIGADSFMFMGAATVDEDRAHELIPFFKPIVNSIPGLMAITRQAGVFERGLGQSRSIDVDISGGSMADLAGVAGGLFGQIREGLEGAQVRPVPSLDMLYPEVNLIPRADRVRAAGMDTRSLGIAADVFLDGRKVSEFPSDGAKQIDVILKASEADIRSPEALSRALIATPNAGVMPLSQLAHVKLGQGVTEIRHFQGRRTLTLRVSPPQTITIQEAMEWLEQEILPTAELKEGMAINLAGTADQLTETVGALKWNFILAVVITYLLMAALFGNFIYPVIILFTVPLATAGGFIGLKMTNLLIAPQALDILTMLGFIILVGIVVNNAILIVHQSLNFIRYQGMEHVAAIKEAVRTRLRPIYMSSLTSIFGMLPLVVMPGPGSEMYRGLGSVITGGLLFSTLFVIFVIPPLLSYVIGMEKNSTDEENGS
jgi:HAE1 family hydrophobic/amphiphilic exporter-1